MNQHHDQWPLKLKISGLLDQDESLL